MKDDRCITCLVLIVSGRKAEPADKNADVIYLMKIRFTNMFNKV